MKRVIVFVMLGICLIMISRPLMSGAGGKITCTGDKSKVCASIRETEPDGSTKDFTLYGDTAIYEFE